MENEEQQRDYNHQLKDIPENTSLTAACNLGPSLYRKQQIQKRWWTPQEDEQLKQVVSIIGKVASYLNDRTDVQCLHRWQKVLNPELVKGPWTKEEDELVVKYVLQYGPKNWSQIAQHLPGRIGKQCRERWHNHLNPDIRKERWTEEEDQQIIKAHHLNNESSNENDNQLQDNNFHNGSFEFQTPLKTKQLITKPELPSKLTTTCKTENNIKYMKQREISPSNSPKNFEYFLNSHSQKKLDNKLEYERNKTISIIVPSFNFQDLSTLPKSSELLEQIQSTISQLSALQILFQKVENASF